MSITRTRIDLEQRRCHYRGACDFEGSAAYGVWHSLVAALLAAAKANAYLKRKAYKVVVIDGHFVEVAAEWNRENNAWRLDSHD